MNQRPMPKNKIIPQMFDVRPVDKSGDLDWEKIKKVGKNFYTSEFSKKAKKKEIAPIELEKKNNCAFKVNVWELGRKIPTDEVPIFRKEKNYFEENYYKKESFFNEAPWDFRLKEKNEEARDISAVNFLEKTKKEGRKSFNFSLGNFIFSTAGKKAHPATKKTADPKSKRKVKKPEWQSSLNIASIGLLRGINSKKYAFSFALFSVLIFAALGVFPLVQKGLFIKESVMANGNAGFLNLASAMENIKTQNFDSSAENFQSAYENFEKASGELDGIGKALIETSRFFPYLSRLSSGKNSLYAGKYISSAGKSLNRTIQTLYSFENPLKQEREGSSLLETFKSAEENLGAANADLLKAQKYLDKIKVDDLPEDKREEFVRLKGKLPEITQAISAFSENSHTFIDILGGNGPRKYLLLFQNNYEMRPTGGFIGSYGLLDIYNGKVRNFYIDGIFNPDGQLTEKIVPPKPIQKVSAAWSLHDSNWFPDFPSSAEKAILFFEKTGGPTVDGVITFTPQVMQRLLEITGPIEMSEYGTTLNAENFIEQTQYEVETDYDKEKNQPKKILSDLAPIVLDKIFSAKDVSSIAKTISAFSNGLSQKQILIYSTNKDFQKIISSQHWSGEMLETKKDYLSVINTNINGYKTDGVVDERIDHLAEIQEDGSIINTVTIIRKHNGGNDEYEWFNKVNADYMRVYVPLGSKLLEAEGQTREFNDPPLDYDLLEFKRDRDIEREESSITIDEKSGTRTYEESGKTVFANWVYVSPQETVTMKYKYLLPFKILFEKQGVADSYSILFQKQSGSLGSNLESQVKYPRNFEISWTYPQNLKNQEKIVKWESDLKEDRFLGIAFILDRKIIVNN